MSHPRRKRPRQTIGSALLAAALCLGTVGTAVADGALPDPVAPGPSPTAPSIDEMLGSLGDGLITNRWLVEIQGNPQIEGGTSDKVKKAQEKAVAAARAGGAKLTVDRSYSSTWNGISVTADLASAKKLARTAGVAGVHPVITVARPQESSTRPNVNTARGMTGADVVNQELGFTGKGIKVGVIDTGIDYNHPDFGGSGVNDQTADFPGTRVRYGWDFVGDAYNADSADPAENTPKPDRWPDDCQGHGSHVAGIVGADGEVTGVAPGVDLGAYRVFGCGEQASSDSEVIMQAMERAYADGMDVINMSLGASFQTWPSYPTAVIADRLVAAGVTMVVSAGNSGAAGLFSGGAPGVAHDVITVGSVDNVEFMASYVTSSAGAEFPFLGSTGSPDPTGGVTMTLTAANPVTACAPATIPADAGANQALLISRGDCSFHEKALNAQAAGYSAALIYNNVDGVINMTVEGEPPITIPAVSLLKVDGAALLKEIAAAGSTTITFSEAPKRFDNPTGGYQSDFSSYGLAADLDLKPDVSAPGGSIYSTYPLERGSYTTLGGTSMSSPHVAGAAALLLEADPSLTPFEVRTALTNTANQIGFSLAPGTPYLEPVFRQGGGLIDIPQAITTKASVSPQKISLGEGEAGPVTTTLTLTNTDDQPVTYRVGARDGIGTYGTASDDFGFYALKADVRLSATEVTVPAHGSAKVTVQIGEDFGVDGALYGGWITLTSTTDVLTVPFAGLSGDYQALTSLQFAAMTFAAEGELFLAEDFHEYSMVGEDLPYLAFALSYPVSELYIDVFRAKADGSKGARVHSNFVNYATELDMGRTEGLVTLAWDGTFQGNNGGNGKLRRVADGDYVLEARVLKGLGDATNPAHWETWVSSPITISYGEGADTGAGNGPAPKPKGKG